MPSCGRTSIIQRGGVRKDSQRILSSRDDEEEGCGTQENCRFDLAAREESQVVGSIIPGSLET